MLKLPRNYQRHFKLCLFCAACIVCSLTRAESFKPTWAASGVDTTLRGYRPLTVLLSANQPASLKQIPDGADGAVMGSFKTGPTQAPVNHAVLLVMKDGLPFRLCVDENGDGEIAREEIHDWVGKPFENAEGERTTNYSCRATVKVTADGRLGQLEFYLPNARGAAPTGHAPGFLAYHTCCGVTGEIKIGERNMQAALEDCNGTGDFSPAAGTGNAPLCWLGLTNESKFGKVFLASRPIEVDGKWWIITNLMASGAFEVVPSAKPEVKAEKHGGPDLSAGQKAPRFTARMMDGKPVSFPADYRGKLVLLDFWATWCGPCMAEVPNVVENYAKYHSQGLEILGITLDKEDAVEKINKVMANKRMNWSQIYDGKFWQAEIARLYGINSIPHMLLVDGDTGVILADKDIRGEKLGDAIQKALAGKQK
jgi:peroxiredoxin